MKTNLETIKTNPSANPFGSEAFGSKCVFACFRTNWKINAISKVLVLALISDQGRPGVACNTFSVDFVQGSKTQFVVPRFGGTHSLNPDWRLPGGHSVDTGQRKIQQGHNMVRSITCDGQEWAEPYCASCDLTKVACRRPRELLLCNKFQLVNLST